MSFARQVRFGSLLLLVASASNSSVLAVEKSAKPNIVFVVADDMGYADLSCYGHPDIKTPRLDQLAREGVRFTHHYSNGPECSPTRTAFMTGRYQQRVPGLECAIGTGNVGRYDEAIAVANNHMLGLRAKDSLIPGGLKREGYEAVIFGKWHLGYEPHFNPLEYGWDKFFGCLGGNVHYFSHRELSKLDVTLIDREPSNLQGYMTHLITEQAVKFIHAPHQKPFFLYVPFTTPHSPYQLPNQANKKVSEQNWNEGTPEEYGGMVEDMDQCIGQILDALDKEKLRENTVVIFISDNGGTKLANHVKLRGLKSGLLEGGIRVPMIARWPGKLPVGKTSTQVCITMDITASMMNIAGGEPLKGRPLDGIDILEHVATKKQNVDRILYWRSKRGTKVWRAVRNGDLKYVQLEGIEGAGQWLYDLSNDESEERDLLSAKPQTVKKLQQLLSVWELDVDKR
jgi:arylsulfatase A-like enzyme